jgi:hypothetical protein
MNRLPILALLALVGACGSTPPASAPPAPAPVVATPDSAAAAPVAAAPAPAAAAPATTDGHFAPAGVQVPVLDPEVAKWARTQQYRPTLRDGKPMWCRTEKQIGSKLDHTECVSESTIVAMRRAYDASKQDMLNALGHCQGTLCGAR